MAGFDERLKRVESELAALIIQREYVLRPGLLGSPGELPPCPIDASPWERQVYATCEAMDASIPRPEPWKIGLND